MYSEKISKNFYTVKNFAKKNKEKGIWPSTEPSIWAIRAHRLKNGFNKAFFTIGGRVLIDEEKFWECVDDSRNKSDT